MCYLKDNLKWSAIFIISEGGRGVERRKKINKERKERGRLLYNDSLKYRNIVISKIYYQLNYVCVV